MDMLGIFDNIEIKNETRIPAEDLKYIEKLEQGFLKSREFHLKMKELIESKEDYSYKEYSGIKQFSKFKIDNLREINYSAFIDETYSYITSIYMYFENKYNVKLNKRSLIKNDSLKFSSYRLNEAMDKLKFFEDIRKEEILDDIFEQLGGFSFEDRPRQEIIDFLKDSTKIYRNDAKRVQAKGKKVTILNLLYFDRWRPESIGSYGNSFAKLEALIKAISMFEFGFVDVEFVKRFTNEKCSHNSKTTGGYEFGNTNKINKIKIFKNGRVDIDFTSTTNTIAFAKEFLSYEV